MASDEFQVQVGEFLGPLDLLLTLIEERKMLVSDISLSKVADDFIAFVKKQVVFPAGQAAQFILIAATLILIKSRTLLPVLSLSDDEEENIADLEKRLALYKIFRDASRVMGHMTGRMYFGGQKRDINPVFAPAPDMTGENVYRALDDVLKRIPRKEVRKEIMVKTVISLEEMMTRLSERIEKALSVTFTDFVGSPEDKREIVVGFLAMLELVKRGLVLVEQDAHFTEITMSYHGTIQSPRYD